MLPSTIFKFGGQALDAVSESFSPSRGATARMIRRNGLACLGVGLVCFALGGALIYTLRSATVAMLPIMLAYAFMVVGAYRAILGKTPEPAHSGEISLKRIAFGITTVVLIFAALFGLIFLCVYIYSQWR